MRLVTERLVLREIAVADLDDLHAVEGDPEVARFQSYAPKSRDEVRAYIERGLDAERESPRRTYDLAIAMGADERLVGRAGLQIVDATLREARLWYVLRRDLWGRGITVEAMRTMVRFGFEELGLHRITAECDPRNAPSARVAEKLGMRREAHFVENYLANGEWLDSWVFAILEREHRAASPASPLRRA